MLLITANAGYHSEAKLAALATMNRAALIPDNGMRTRDERVNECPAIGGGEHRLSVADQRNDRCDGSGRVLGALRAKAQALIAVPIAEADRSFKASTSFTNPTAAIGGIISDSLAGLAPRGVPPFMLAQWLGARIGPSSQRWPGPARSPFPRFGRSRYSVPFRRPRAAFDSSP